LSRWRADLATSDAQGEARLISGLFCVAIERLGDADQDADDRTLAEGRVLRWRADLATVDAQGEARLISGVCFAIDRVADAERDASSAGFYFAIDHISDAGACGALPR
jgi:hypothetical protein